MSTKAKQPAGYPLRLPPELRHQIEQLTAASGRSINAEITLLLTNALASKDAKAQKFDIEELAEVVAAKVVEKLKLAGTGQ